MIKDYSKQPIMITGAARSGTSMVAGIIHKCGAWKGVTRGPNKYNAKGMFENHAIVQNIIKPYLSSIKCDKLGQYPVPDTDKIPIPNDFYDKVMGIIQKEGWKSNLPWMYKGAKMTFLWPMWLHAFPDTKWVIVRRRSADIVNSCLRTGFMRAYANPHTQRRIGVSTEKEGWLWWIHRHEEQWIKLMQKGANVKIVWPERMIDSDYKQMKETIEWLGLEWDEKAIIDFIEPKLWKARKRA